MVGVNRLQVGSGSPWAHRVVYVDRTDAGNNQDQVFDCSHIAVCTGLHVEPNIPQIPGIENIRGDVFHSSLYKERAQVAGRNVLVLGCGETAMGEFAQSIFKMTF